MKPARSYKQIREAIHGPHQQVNNLSKEVLDRVFSRRIVIKVNNCAVAEKSVPINY